MYSEKFKSIKSSRCFKLFEMDAYKSEALHSSKIIGVLVCSRSKVILTFSKEDYHV